MVFQRLRPEMVTSIFNFFSHQTRVKTSNSEDVWLKVMKELKWWKTKELISYLYMSVGVMKDSFITPTLIYKYDVYLSIYREI
jgi:hypothetical protein